MVIASSSMRGGRRSYWAVLMILVVGWFLFGRHGSSGGSRRKLVQGHDTIHREQFIQKLNALGMQAIQPSTQLHYSRLEINVKTSSRFVEALWQEADTSFPEMLQLEPGNNDVSSKSSHVARTTILGAVPQRQVAAPHLVFGCATLLDRLEVSLPAFSHWLAGTGATMVVIIQDGPAQVEIDRVAQKARDMDMNIIIKPSTKKFNDRYMLALQAVHEHINGSKEIKWAIIMDDDTFWPSTRRLLELLGKYDHTQPLYVGGLSEDWHVTSENGLMAFGGAGVYLSIPLLDQLMLHFDDCMHADKGHGDARIFVCVGDYTSTRLSYEPSLHQLDIKGDVTGFFEALRPPPVSVHHWKSWYHLPMYDSTLVSKICGESCIFQKYHLADDWVLTNGVSLVKYSTKWDPNDVRMENTWRKSFQAKQEDAWRHSLAPTKPRDGKKISYTFRAAILDEATGAVRQFYVRQEALPQAAKRADNVKDTTGKQRLPRALNNEKNVVGQSTQPEAKVKKDSNKDVVQAADKAMVLEVLWS